MANRTQRLLAANSAGFAVVLAVLAVALLRRQAPAATEPHKIDYATDIRPIFESNCAKCHLNGVRKGSLDLGSLDSLLKGGESEEPAIVPHNSANSRLVKLITSDDPEMAMPQKAKPLSKEQIATIKTWIDNGALWGNAPGAEPKYVAPLEPRKPALPEGKEANPIDRLLAPYYVQHKFVPPDVVGDRTYARRVYLDTIGLLPTGAEVEAFVTDTRANKRELLVQQLLGEKRKYAEHWLSFWNDALRNDYQGTGYVDGLRKQITSWLYKSLYDNMPYDQFARMLISPNADSDGFINGIMWRGAVSVSQGKEMQAAQNITQIFLGLNFKCNSCHDSFISDWKLADAYGLASVFADKPMEMLRCEIPTGTIAPVKFLYPQLGAIDGSASRRTRLKQLAHLLTEKEDGRFARTIVNRLWGRFVGRGIVEPVDEMDQKPWNADLLDWLASDLADNNYDLKHTIALILTSRAYQLPAVGMHERLEPDFAFTGPIVRRLTAEEFCDAVSGLTGTWHAAPVSKQAMALPEFELPAHWIWTEASARMGTPKAEIYLRRVVELPDLPAEAIVAADGDDAYDLTVNGKPVLSGTDLNKPDVVDLKPFLVKGPNIFAAVARNDLQRNENTHETVQGPAGFWMLASIRFESGQIMTVATGSNWLASKTKSPGWDTVKFDPATWAPAVDIGDAAASPWRLPEKLAKSEKEFTFQFDGVRAVWVNNDAIMSAMGRPNREHVVMDRFSPATMLQILELTNGKTLAGYIETGAGHWKARNYSTTRELVEQMYKESLGRAPSEKELQLASDMVGSPARQDGVEDLLWSLLMLPEFQLVY